MASSVIKKMGGVVRKTYTQGISANLFYHTAYFNISNTGYTPISAIATVDQARYHVQVVDLGDSQAAVRVADYTASSMNVTVTLTVTYIRNDLA